MSVIKFLSKKTIRSRNILIGIDGINSTRPLSLTRDLILEMNSGKICLYQIWNDAMKYVVLSHWNGSHQLSTSPTNTRTAFLQFYHCLVQWIRMAAARQMYTAWPIMTTKTTMMIMMIGMALKNMNTVVLVLILTLLCTNLLWDWHSGSNHTSKNKHFSVYHLNPTSASWRCDSIIAKKRGGVGSASVSPTKSISKLCKRSPMLPIQEAYAQVKKERNKMFDLLEKIPQTKRIKWNLTSQSKFVPDPLPPITSRPVVYSLFFNPFKFKQGHRPESKPKNDNQGAKKKVKGRAQPLELLEQ